MSCLFFNGEGKVFIKKHEGKIKKLMMVSGLWMQNVGMQKLKLLVLNY
jgi:hypothetical protein